MAAEHACLGALELGYILRSVKCRKFDGHEILSPQPIRMIQWASYMRQKAKKKKKKKKGKIFTH